MFSQLQKKDLTQVVSAEAVRQVGVSSQDVRWEPPLAHTCRCHARGAGARVLP